MQVGRKNLYYLVQGLSKKDDDDIIQELRDRKIPFYWHIGYNMMQQKVNVLVVDKKDIRKAAKVFDDLGYIDKKESIKNAQLITDPDLRIVRDRG